MYNEVKTRFRVLLFFLGSLNDIHVALLDNFHIMADDSKTRIESHFDQTPVLGIKGCSTCRAFCHFRRPKAVTPAAVATSKALLLCGDTWCGKEEKEKRL